MARRRSRPVLAMWVTALALVAASALAAAACTPGSMSRERAIELAREAAGPAAVPVRAELAALGRIAGPRTLPEEPRDRLVWAVVFSGDFPGSCVVGVDGTSHCPPGAATKLIVLDARTGAFIFSESPAP